MSAEEYPRTNDAWLYSHEWDAEAGAYIIYLDFLCNGGLVCRERIGRVDWDGRAHVEAQLYDAPGQVKPTHPSLYAVIHGGETSSNATILTAEPIHFDG
jgi:hypothetical protein